MRVAVVVALLLGLLRAAHADKATPVRVHVECEDTGRTKACPAFLLGFVDAAKVLLQSPRASAEVVLYATANEIALVDRVHLRFVGTVTGAPSVIEIDVDVDTRADDDTQRAQLEPAFTRGIALFVAARHPKLVTVTLGTPDGVELVKPDTTPWGFSVNLGGFGNWTQNYQNYSGYASAEISRLTPLSHLRWSAGSSGGINRQPSLVLNDGTRVALDTKQWNVSSTVAGAWLYDPCWSFGGGVHVSHDDPKGQYAYSGNAKAGVEWDKYAADDPRGNRLAVMYYAGYQVERYNLRNVLHERFAQFPIHALVASGTLRKDKVGIGVSFSIGGEMLHPGRRHNISASPFIEWQLGGHIDLNFNFSITKRELPAPDPSVIDPSDYEVLSRLSYAEPLSMNGSFNVTVHWDRTNGARNDRFEDL